MYVCVWVRACMCVRVRVWIVWFIGIRTLWRRVCVCVCVCVCVFRDTVEGNQGGKVSTGGRRKSGGTEGVVAQEGRSGENVRARMTTLVGSGLVIDLIGHVWGCES